MGLVSTYTNSFKTWAANLLNVLSSTLDVWEQDATLTAENVDDVLIRKGDDGFYYRLVFDTLPVERFGIDRKNTPAQNDLGWQKLVSCQIDYEILTWRKGKYRFASSLYTYGHHLRMRGVGPGTQIVVPASAIGARFKYGTIRLDDLEFSAEGKDPNDGVPNFSFVNQVDGNNNALPSDVQGMFNYAKTLKWHAVLVEAVVTFNNVGAQGFSGHCFRLDGDKINKGTNCSLSRITNCYGSPGSRYQNGGCGIFSTGPDANACTIFGCNFTNSPQAGLFDGSLLGSYHLTNHASECHWGQRHSISLVAQTGWLFEYHEGGSAVSTTGPLSTAIGGTRGSYMQGGFNLDGQECLSELGFKQLRFSSDKITFQNYSRNSGLELRTFSNEKQLLPWWGWSPSSQPDTIPHVLDLASTGVALPVRHRPVATRTTHGDILAVRELLIDGTYFGATVGFPFTDVQHTLRPGDYLTNALATPTTPGGWVCKRGGYTNPPAFVENLTANSTNEAADGVYNYVLQLSAPTEQLQVGHYVTVKDISQPIKEISVDRTQLTFDQAMPLGTGMYITYAQALLTAAISLSEEGGLVLPAGNDQVQVRVMQNPNTQEYMWAFNKL